MVFSLCKRWKGTFKIIHCLSFCIGPGSAVGIATSYGLDGPGIESRWGARFSAPVQTSPGAHPASCTMSTRSFLGGKEQLEHDANPSPPSSAIGHERVELYLYSPYGLYGLYRAPVPAQGCTLPYLFSLCWRYHFDTICKRESEAGDHSM